MVRQYRMMGYYTVLKQKKRKKKYIQKQYKIIKKTIYENNTIYKNNSRQCKTTSKMKKN